jgi:hypothetical protein
MMNDLNITEHANDEYAESTPKYSQDVDGDEELEPPPKMLLSIAGLCDLVKVLTAFAEQEQTVTDGTSFDNVRGERTP